MFSAGLPWAEGLERGDQARDAEVAVALEIREIVRVRGPHRRHFDLVAIATKGDAGFVELREQRRELVRARRRREPTVAVARGALEGLALRCHR